MTSCETEIIVVLVQCADMDRLDIQLSFPLYELYYVVNEL